MLNRFAIKFTKTGYVKYISHLDLLKCFKLAFKKNGIELKYSQGYNPHPRLGLAQPLSLGYSSVCELLEFETLRPYEPSELLEILKDQLPEGIDLVSCSQLPDSVKTLSGETVYASYRILIPLGDDAERDWQGIISDYLSRESIVTLKRMKKTKQLEPVEIRHMIKSLLGTVLGKDLLLTCRADCGSQSNLSPELIINSFLEFAGLNCRRCDIEVERTGLEFTNNLQF